MSWSDDAATICELIAAFLKDNPPPYSPRNQEGIDLLIEASAEIQHLRKLPTGGTKTDIQDRMRAFGNAERVADLGEMEMRIRLLSFTAFYEIGRLGLRGVSQDAGYVNQAHEWENHGGDPL